MSADREHPQGWMPEAQEGRKEAMSGLDELLSRVEGASGPDRELDRDLHAALGLDMKDVVHQGAMWNLYTASLDAALALVERVRPDLLGWKVERCDAPFARLYFPSDAATSSHVLTVANPALAVCSALLRSMLPLAAGQGASGSVVDGATHKTTSPDHG